MPNPVEVGVGRGTNRKGSWEKLCLNWDLKDKLVICVQKHKEHLRIEKNPREKAQRQDSTSEVSIREEEAGWGEPGEVTPAPETLVLVPACLFLKSVGRIQMQ